MPRKPARPARRAAVLALELGGFCAILVAVAMWQLWVAVALAGVLAVAVAQRPEELL